MARLGREEGLAALSIRLATGKRIKLADLRSFARVVRTRGPQSFAMCWGCPRTKRRACTLCGPIRARRGGAGRTMLGSGQPVARQGRFGWARSAVASAHACSTAGLLCTKVGCSFGSPCRPPVSGCGFGAVLSSMALTHSKSGLGIGRVW